MPGKCDDAIQVTSQYARTAAVEKMILEATAENSSRDETVQTCRERGEATVRRQWITHSVGLTIC